MSLPEPYYQDDAVQIFHGDCREVLPEIRPAEVALVDPPYGIEGGKGLGAVRGRGDYAGDAFSDDRDYVESVVVPVVRNLRRTIGCIVVTPGNKNLDLYPQAQSFGAFYQPAAVGLQTFGNLDAQPILYYGKNASKRVMGSPCSYVLTEAPEKNGHPCPKPLKAWRVLLNNVSLPGQTVLDPFMGSGTTLRAAKDLGRKAIGIELEERYCEIAAQRCAQDVLDLGAAA